MAIMRAILDIGSCNCTDNLKLSSPTFRRDRLSVLRLL
jgi:hypothetical protein